jgi:hypothetical protein
MPDAVAQVLLRLCELVAGLSQSKATQMCSRNDLGPQITSARVHKRHTVDVVDSVNLYRVLYSRCTCAPVTHAVWRQCREQQPQLKQGLVLAALRPCMKVLARRRTWLQRASHMHRVSETNTHNAHTHAQYSTRQHKHVRTAQRTRQTSTARCLSTPTHVSHAFALGGGTVSACPVSCRDTTTGTCHAQK